MSKWAENLDEVIAELRAILARMDGDEDSGGSGRTKPEGDEDKPLSPGKIPIGRGFNLSGDAMFGFDIETGGRGDGGKGKPSDCKRTGNDYFSHLSYLKCRCSKGDTGACAAANQMMAQGR